MRTLRPLLLLCLSFPVYSQTDTVPCIQTRWTIIEPTMENASIFNLDGKLPENNLFSSVKDLALAGDLVLYQQTTESVRFETLWTPIELITTHTFPCSDSTWTTELADVFKKVIWPDVPLVDERGEPLTQELEDGTLVFLYPDPDTVDISLEMINHLRIREERMIADDGASYYAVTGIGFFMDHGYGKGEILFWVSFFELAEIYQKKAKPDWFTALESGNFSGFQYMQKPCAK